MTKVLFKKRNKKQIKLELGPGDKPKEGYIHLDIRKLPHIEIIGDCAKLDMCEDESIDEIYTCHLIEHLSWRKIPEIIQEWYRVLKKGGKIIINCPNLKLFCTLWVNGFFVDAQALRSIYGDQDYEENYHKAGFSIGTLGYLLAKAGFKDIHDSMMGTPNPDCIILMTAIK